MSPHSGQPLGRWVNVGSAVFMYMNSKQGRRTPQCRALKKCVCGVVWCVGGVISSGARDKSLRADWIDTGELVNNNCVTDDL